PEQGLIVVEGAGPGHKGSWLTIKAAAKEPLRKDVPTPAGLEGKGGRADAAVEAQPEAAEAQAKELRRHGLMKVAVNTLENKQAGDLDLSDAIFGLEPRADILHRMVNWQLANRRSGNHKTKGVSEISGTGKKPFKQKGTGHARAGSMRNAHHRTGAVIFGPLVRDHSHDLPKSVRKLALKVDLSAKQKEGKLIVLDAAKSDSHKTKEMAKALETLGIK